MYCTVCGKELLAKETEGFDFKTGKKNYELVCPTDLCGHFGYDHLYRPLGWFSREAGCLRCGHITQCASD